MFKTILKKQLETYIVTINEGKNTKANKYILTNDKNVNHNQTNLIKW